MNIYIKMKLAIGLLYFLQPLTYIKGEYTYIYKGCFEYSSSAYAVYTSSACCNSIEYCVSYCGQDGYKYAALSVVVCHCGTPESAYNKYSNNSSCNQRCVGNQKQICGGLYDVSVYEIVDVSITSATSTKPTAAAPTAATPTTTTSITTTSITTTPTTTTPTTTTPTTTTPTTTTPTTTTPTTTTTTTPTTTTPTATIVTTTTTAITPPVNKGSLRKESTSDASNNDENNSIYIGIAVGAVVVCSITVLVVVLVVVVLHKRFKRRRVIMEKPGTQGEDGTTSTNDTTEYEIVDTSAMYETINVDHELDIYKLNRQYSANHIYEEVGAKTTSFSGDLSNAQQGDFDEANESDGYQGPDMPDGSDTDSYIEVLPPLPLDYDRDF